MGSCASSPAEHHSDPSPTAPGSPGTGDKATVKWASSKLNILPACEPIRLLGEGTFGTVVLVRERATREFFAIKVMNKFQLLHEGQLDNIITERQVLREAGPHPFVVECHSGFQTPQAVVLVLEYVPGGDMYDLIRQHGCLSEHQMRFYLAEIVVALAELHRHNFVFRDLKLENILIDSVGHCRLTDFGLAGKVEYNSAVGEEELMFDISGTAIYQAPEMLAGKGHGRVVDWWALGVLAYVLLAGRPPFRGDSNEALYDQIQTHQLNLDNDEKLQHVSDTAKDFILKLLDKNPATRLGSAGTDAKDVQNHPFFEDMDWVDVSAMQLTPPLAPGLSPDNKTKNPEDVKIAQSKLAEKVLRTYKPSRATMGKLKRDIDAGEYKMVMTNRNRAQGRVSIGLDFQGRNSQAERRTWMGTADDFGRELTSLTATNVKTTPATTTSSSSTTNNTST